MINSKQVKQLAKVAGFDLVGIARPDIIEPDSSRFKQWIEKGYQAEMEWLSRSSERRTDPGKVLESVKSVIMLGLNYYQPDSDSVPNGYGKVSRYARGRDYHKVIENKIKKFSQLLSEQTGVADTYWSVDYGPMLERSYAARAGLGFVGKNSMLINPEFGSWIFLAEVLTSLELEPDEYKISSADQCGECRICVESCPTGAIADGRTVNAAKCISYLTIERPEEIHPAYAMQFGDMVFGCDICQAVCPLNSVAKETAHEELQADNGVGEFLDLGEVLSMNSEDQFYDLTAGTPLTRPKLAGLQRNANIVLENQARRIKKED